jgi:hypothetical protein
MVRSTMRETATKRVRLPPIDLENFVAGTVA